MVTNSDKIMRLLYKEIISALSIIAISVACSSDLESITPTQSGSISITDSQIYYEEIREGVEAQQNDVMGNGYYVDSPYVELSYESSTGGRFSITPIDMPRGLYLNSEIQMPLSSESGTIELLIYGQSEVYGTDLPFTFAISSGDFYQEVEHTIDILGSGEGNPDVVIKSVSCSLSEIWKWISVDGATITIDYKSGYGRTIDVEIVSPDGISIAEGSEQVTLSNGDADDMVEVPISGVLKSSDSPIKMEVRMIYRDSDNIKQSTTKFTEEITVNVY